MQEENAPRIVFPSTLHRGYFTNCQLRGCRDRCGYRQHELHLPGAEAVAAQENRTAGAQRTCRQEPGGPSIVVLQLQLLFQKIHTTHSYSEHLKGNLAPAK